jgi:hypothetical protein
MYYDVTLWRVRVTDVAAETQERVLVWLGYMSLSRIWKYWLRHKNAFMVYLCPR